MRLAEEVKKLDIEGVDFHAGLMGTTEGAADKIKEALAATGLELSGISLSDNFNQDDPAELEKQVQTVKDWLAVAAEVGAPVSRIFGGHVGDRSDEAEVKRIGEIIFGALEDVTKEAEKLGIVLALENHGGYPATGEEQVEVIERVGSDNLRATIDVGNYMSVGQEGHVGSEIAAKYTSYIHFKDFIKKDDPEKPWGWGIQSCIVGDGDVDHKACLKAIADTGYDGFVAIEYEGPNDEYEGVAKSVEFTKEVMKDFR